MNATPPPLPVVRGLCMREKIFGVREFKVEGRVSGVSQVSDRAKISMPWSEMNSCRMVGLSSEAVTEEAEQMLRWANWIVVLVGPGFS